METFDGDSMVSMVDGNSQDDQQIDRNDENVGHEATSGLSHHGRESNEYKAWPVERNHCDEIEAGPYRHDRECHDNKGRQLVSSERGHRGNGGRRSCNDREAHESKDRPRKRGQVITQSTGTLFGDGPEMLPKARKSAYWERERIVDSATVIGSVKIVGEEVREDAPVAAPESTRRDDSETGTEHNIDPQSSNRRRLFLGNIPAYLSKPALMKKLKENIEGFKEIVALSKSEHGDSKKCGFIEFYSNKAASTALAQLLSGDISIFKSDDVIYDWADHFEECDAFELKEICLRNLQQGVKKADLSKIFSAYRPTAVKLSGLIAVIQFSDSESTSAALEDPKLKELLGSEAEINRSRPQNYAKEIERVLSSQNDRYLSLPEGSLSSVLRAKLHLQSIGSSSGLPSTKRSKLSYQYVLEKDPLTKCRYGPTRQECFEKKQLRFYSTCDFVHADDE